MARKAKASKPTAAGLTLGKEQKGCPCGCGQANTGRLRKLSCPVCGYIVYTSRTRINEGLPQCPCGTSLEPPCVQDRVAVNGPIGDDAWAEMAGRAARYGYKSERGSWGNERKNANQRARKARETRDLAAGRVACDLPF